MAALMLWCAVQNVVTLTGTDGQPHLFTESQFAPAAPDACPTVHHHAANGINVTALDGHVLPDPDPSACGFGLLSFGPLSSANPDLVKATDLAILNGVDEAYRWRPDAAEAAPKNPLVDEDRAAVHRSGADASLMTDYVLPEGGTVNGAAIDFLTLIARYNLGRGMIRNFIREDGSLEIVGGDPGAVNEAVYGQITNNITVRSNRVGEDGSLRLYGDPSDESTLGTAFIANVLHEFWHAYYDQVVERNADGPLYWAFRDVMQFLESARMRPADDPDHPVLGRDVNWDDEVAADEYIGHIVYDIALQYLRIMVELRQGNIDRTEARHRWGTAVNQIRNGPYDAYDPSTDAHTVIDPPPAEVVDRILDLLGVRNPFADAQP